MPEKKKPQQRHGFRTNEYIVYPAHGVGRIVSIEEQEIAGATLELFVINFEKDKMTLRVPTGKLEPVGMRKLSEDKIVKKALGTLKGKARVKRTMWSRRAHGIRGQDQFRQPCRHRRGGARPVPVRGPARAVLFRAAALRSRARSHGAGDCRRRAHG